MKTGLITLIPFTKVVLKRNLCVELYKNLLLGYGSDLSWLFYIFISTDLLPN